MAENNFISRPDEGSLRLFLVRHGQTDANLNRRLQGASNGLLNAEGIRQVHRLGRHLQRVALDHIFASDLQRAVDTAGAIAHFHGLQVELDSRLREWDCGELDGQPAAVFLKLVDECGGRLSHIYPPGGEHLSQVQARARAFIGDLIERDIGQSVLACSHGDLMRMIVSTLLQIDIDTASAFHFDNASYSVFEYSHGRWRVVALNRLAVECQPDD